MDLINKYFPEITDDQRKQFSSLKELYAYWNSQINLISRKDVDHFVERHVLHSLGIAKVHSFGPGEKVLDVGTGGGFPGIPLAIMFPDTEFTLVDSIGKKIMVVNEVIDALKLKNANGINERAEKVPGPFDYVVSRAVTRIDKFIPWVKGKVNKPDYGPVHRGILYLKGGDLREELKRVKKYRLFELSEQFEEEFFETKKVLYISSKDF